MERQIELVQVGQLSGSFETSGRVYSPDGLCPTLSTMGGGNQEPKIIDPQGRLGKECVPSDLCPTLRAQIHGNPPQVIATINIPCMNKQGFMEATDGDGIVTSRQHQVRSTVLNQVGFAIRAGNAGDSGVALAVGQKMRVRKLIPLECWRLMGFSDQDFYKAKAALNKTFYKGRDRSDSQLYKQAGNSIVVPVLMAIKKQMLRGEVK